MRFDIEGFVTFDTEEASLVNLLTGDCIELSATSTRLLTSLLQYRGDIISRIDIFQIVFEKYGATPSNSNLNQYISTLRRSLANLGIEKNVIITVPRVGFKISDDIIVTTDSDYQSSFTISTITPEPPKWSFIWQQHKLSIFCLLFSIFILFLIYLTPYKKRSNNKITTHDKCSIYAPDAISMAEVVNKIKNKNPLPSVINCSTPGNIYFFEQNINNDPDLGIYKNVFILKCDITNKKCYSYYYKEIKNA